MNLLGKMNNLNLIENKVPKVKAPIVPDLNNSIFNKVIPNPIVSINRKKPLEPARQIIAQASNIAQTANKLSESLLLQCQISVQDESGQYLENIISKQISLNTEELGQLLAFAEEIEQKRRLQEKNQQESRSWKIAEKIQNYQNGKEFLAQNSISCIGQSEQGSEWHQSLLIIKDENNQEEISQALNFYNPQHSWILESWLSQQATSWTVRRYCPNPEQVIYQVSFGFPDQTFLEAEGPSREASIVAIAEDLLED